MLDVCLNMDTYIPNNGQFKSLDLEFYLEDVVKPYRKERQYYNQAKEIIHGVYKKYFVSQPKTEWQKDLGLQRATLTAMVIVIRDINKEYHRRLRSTALQQACSKLKSLLTICFVANFLSCFF